MLWLVISILVATTSSAVERKEADVTVYGFKMHYVEAGTGDPVILLHGLWGGLNEWEPNVDALGEDFRVIVLDQIGFGDSDKPEAMYHNKLLAQFLAGFMRALGMEKASLVGHAMGATTGTYFAVHYPDMVDKLVLVDGVGYQRDRPANEPSPPPTPARINFQRIASGSTVEETRALLKRRVYNDSLVTDAWAEEAFFIWLNASRAIREMIATGGAVTKEEMRTIKAPTLVIWGEKDEIGGPDSADEPLGDIANSSKYIVPNAGHLPQVEQPDILNRVVSEFIKTGEVSPF